MELSLAVSPGELTRAEQKILDYINTNTDAFLFSSIGQLAQRLGLSDATVSRFARHAGCADFKGLKTLVVEQAAGPAAKMAGTLSQDGVFLLPHGWSASSSICKKPLNSWIRRNLTGVWKLWPLHGRSSCTGKTPPLPWRKCWPSACGVWGFRSRCCPPAAQNCWRDCSRQASQDLVVMFSFSKLSREGRVILEHRRAAGYGPSPLSAVPVSLRKNRRISACLPTAARRRNTTPWPPPPLCWMSSPSL